MDIVLQLIINAVIAASVYALIASGLSFIYATTRVFHLAHGAVIAFSGYVFWWCSTERELPIFLSGLIACLIALLLGTAMNELVYEPLKARKTKGLGYLMATIALLMFCNAAIIAIFGAQTNSIGIQTKVYDFGGVYISLLQIFIIIVSFSLLFALSAFMKGTKFGKAMRAVADNDEVAQVLGIKIKMIRRLTFAIGSLLGGIAGIFIALEFNLEPNMSVMMAIKGFTAMVVGGAGSMSGAIAGSLVLAGVEQAAVWFWGASWKNSMSFILLSLFLLIKPQGISGLKKFN